MGELSMRHIPDLSDASGIADFSDSSFQIPVAARNTDDLLLAEDTMDFLNSGNETLSTPAPSFRPRPQLPLTLAELTPRSKPAHTGPNRSSLFTYTKVATPYKETVINELSTALSEELSPFRKQDPSFQIPPDCGDALLIADDGANFLDTEPTSLDDSTRPSAASLSSSQLTPSLDSQPAYALSVTPTRPPLDLPEDPHTLSASSNDIHLTTGSPQRDVDGGTTVYVPAVTSPITSNAAGVVPEEKHSYNSDMTSKKGKGKALTRTNLLGRQKPSPSGDKAKRKRVHPSVAVPHPAKLKPLTASLARRLSNSGKKPAAAVRRRPQGQSSSVRAIEQGKNMTERPFKSPRNSVDAKPFQITGLADTLMSFGKKMIADTVGLEHSGDGSGETKEDSVVPAPQDTTGHDEGRPIVPTCDSLEHHDVLQSSGVSYLTLSQLSPRKCQRTEPSAAPISHGDEGAAVTLLDRPASPTTVSSGRPQSPMRRSIKRSASPAGDAGEHQRKRSKTLSASSVPSSSKELKTRKPTLQPSRAKNAPAAPTRSGPSRLSGTRRVVSATASVIGADRTAKAGGARKPGSTSLRPTSKSTTVSGQDAVASAGTSDLRLTKPRQNLRNPGAPAVGQTCLLSVTTAQGVIAHDGQERRTNVQNLSRSTSITSTVVDGKAANSLPAKSTKPMEFHFATSTRMEARSQTELQKSGGASQSLRRSRAQAHPIPDFKALHAAQESVLAQKRAEIHPTVPIGFDLATESRAHDREKYEESRRTREMELERQAEERRRQRELEEEAEIRELRRRAVPKAHEVPDWYAFAPKKAKADSTGS